MKKSFTKIIFILSVVYALLIELLFYLSLVNNILNVRYMLFLSVFPLVFVIVSVIIDVKKKKHEEKSITRVYLPIILIFYYFILGTGILYHYFDEFTAFLLFIILPNFILILYTIMLINVKKQKYLRYFVVGKYIFATVFMMYWYIIFWVLQVAQ